MPTPTRPGRTGVAPGRGGVGATVLVLLGAGRPARGTLPSALVRAGAQRRTLDWLLDAFGELAVDRISFVGGYRFEQVAREYPHLNVAINKDWRSTGPVGSLMTIPLDPGCTAYVSYTDVVYSRDAPLRLDSAGGDVVLAMDPGWRGRFAGRPMIDLKRAEKVQLCDGRITRVGSGLPLGEASGEFMGLVKLGPSATSHLAALHKQSPRAWARSPLPELLQRFVDDGLEVRAVELPGRWAELNAPQDLARFVLGTKASTLLRLQSLVERSTVPSSVSFAADVWESEQEAVLAEIAAAFAPSEVIVRSSSAREDSWTSSNAGAFLSVTSVAADDRDAVVAAVDEVVASYAPRTRDDEVLVQEVVNDVAAAGVVMTRSPRTGAPYFVVNLDDVSGRTDAVTAGASGHRTLFVHRPDAHQPLDRTVASVIAMAAEVEQLVGHDSLDLEFAVDREGDVKLLQARPIVSDYRDWKTPDEDVAAALADAELDLERIAEATPFVLGDSFCLGVMPDWNPAEIVGVKPRRLALSLYQHLITDEVWAQQRAEFGYRDVRPCPLVVTLAGQPFVDVRASFNSFIPAVLSDALARELVNHYVDQLRAHPELHDKVEFEIALTCKGFDFTDRAGALLGDVLSSSDLVLLDESLTRLTFDAVACLNEHVAACGQLRARADVIAANVADPLDRAYLLLEDCRRIGTRAFAHLARDAFVAVEWLRSLVRRGVLEQALVDSFLASLHTVSSRFSEDVPRLLAGAIEWDEFLGSYGHLRPGTYEITSPCYAEGMERYLALGEHAQRPEPAVDRVPFRWPAKESRAIEMCLRDANLPLEFEAFDEFVRRAIEQREGSKFTFTRNLSDALEDLALFGAGIGLSREELSHVRIEEFLRLRRGSDAGIAETLAALAEAGEGAYRRSLAVELPTLVFGDEDLRAFEQAEVTANFVTNKSVRAPVVMVGNGAPTQQSLEGTIAVIGSADPGYDWLFTRRIAGLVTAYGGVNSHMAIRAAEQSLPAAIGVGIHEHDRLVDAQVLELNCAARTMRVVV